MTFQDEGTPWGSGVADRPRAERELCAASESKQTQPDKGWVDSTAGSRMFNESVP